MLKAITARFFDSRGSRRIVSMRRSSWRQVLAMLMLSGGLGWAAGMAQAADTAEAPHDPLQSQNQQQARVQQCTMACGQELARCEHGVAVGGHCSRYFQSCKSDCTAGTAPAQVAATQSLSVCEQRCDTAGALCQQNGQNSIAVCSSGVSACNARCEGRPTTLQAVAAGNPKPLFLQPRH